MGKGDTRRSLVSATIVVGSIVAGFGFPATSRAWSVDENTVLKLVAVTRAEAGLGALRSSATLSRIAHAQAERMLASGRIFHSSHLGADLDAAKVAWTKWGENVGAGPSVRPVEAAFMTSEHHRENILDPSYEAVGVGVAKATDGRVYVTQVFARASAPTRACPRSLLAEDHTRVAPTYYGLSC